MKLATRHGCFTFEDFCCRVKDGDKADLIDGVIYMASPENLAAGDLYVWLIRLLSDFLEVFDLGKVYGSRIAFRLDDFNSPEPDLGVVRKERLHLERKGFFLGAPDLAIEIVSPDSVERDYVDKRALYERFKVQEYWIFDEDMKKVTSLRLDNKGKFREVRLKKGELHSQVLPGFWLQTEWLWKETRPAKSAALAHILARE